MKTLVETINEIKNNNLSIAAKKRALAALNLRPGEIGCLIDRWLAEGAIDAPAPRRAYKYTFGIELEVYNAIRREILNAAADNGITARYEGYNHVDNTSYFKFVSDASLSGNDTIECVSPILTEGRDGYASVKAVCKTLNEAGAKVNRSCGYHIHIGGAITDEQYVNVFVNYRHLQEAINLFLAPSRRNCHWAAPLADVSDCTNPSQVLRRLGTRYTAVNADAWSRHHTIEFRQHQGTTNADKVLAWAKFCIKLVEYSRTHRLETDITSIDEIPFITAAEKRYFKARQTELAGVTE